MAVGGVAQQVHRLGDLAGVAQGAGQAQAFLGKRASRGVIAWQRGGIGQGAQQHQDVERVAHAAQQGQRFLEPGPGAGLIALAQIDHAQVVERPGQDPGVADRAG